MLRFLGFAVLPLVAICLALGASIALAVGGAVLTPEAVDGRTIEAVDPDRRVIDDSLAAAEDVYEFDFPVKAQSEPHPEFEEPANLSEI